MSRRLSTVKASTVVPDFAAPACGSSTGGGVGRDGPAMVWLCKEGAVAGTEGGVFLYRKEFTQGAVEVTGYVWIRLWEGKKAAYSSTYC